MFTYSFSLSLSLSLPLSLSLFPPFLFLSPPFLSLPLTPILSFHTRLFVILLPECVKGVFLASFTTVFAPFSLVGQETPTCQTASSTKVCLSLCVSLYLLVFLPLSDSVYFSLSLSLSPSLSLCLPVSLCLSLSDSLSLYVSRFLSCSFLSIPVLLPSISLIPSHPDTSQASSTLSLSRFMEEVLLKAVYSLRLTSCLKSNMRR